MVDFDIVYELSENRSKWRYLRVQYWLARIKWYQVKQSVRKGPLRPWREIFDEVGEKE